jgi:hypothetical protein
LFIKYPGLKNVIRGNGSADEFLRRNPGFLDDASIRLYKKNPEMFSAKFEEQRLLLIKPSAFDSVLKQQVEIQNQDDLASFNDRVRDKMDRAGHTATALATMSEEQRQKLVQSYIQQELSVQAPNRYKWTYKSGSLVVSGKIGNLEFEQEVSAEWMLKATLVTAGGIKGKELIWKREEFHKDTTCMVSYLCIKDDGLSSQVASKEHSSPEKGNDTLMRCASWRLLQYREKAVRLPLQPSCHIQSSFDYLPASCTVDFR